ncbi:MAG: PQQ-dependent sugar dehydrogenase [Limisphaerales bacterium]
MYSSRQIGSRYFFQCAKRCFGCLALASVGFLIFFGNVISASASIPGTIVRWGNSSFTEKQPPSNLTNVVSISANYHTLALRADGTVEGWGEESYGDATPPAGLTNVVAVSAGNDHSLALLANGTVVQWGGSPFMPSVPTGLNDAAAIAAGYNYSLVVRSNGTVIGWALGYNPATNVPPTLTNAIEIAAGAYSAVALTRDGKAVTWGGADYNVGLTNVPPSATNVIAVAMAGPTAYALRSDGTIVAWGDTIWGDYTLHTAPPAGLSNVIGIGSQMALKADGAVVVWGLSDPMYQPPIGLSNVIAVASGGGRFYATVLVDDAHPPSVTSLDGQTAEGDVTNNLSLKVTLLAPSTKEVSLAFETVEDTAKAGKDFVSIHGRIIVPPNVTTQTFDIPIIGDSLKEPTETFFVKFLAPSNAVLVTTQIVVTIFDDDTLEVPPGFGVSLIDTNLNYPTALDFAPDGRIFVCEQEGRVQVIKNGIRLPSPFLELPTTTEDYAEAGLLGIAFDPQFATNQYIYVYYTVPGRYFPTVIPPHNRISRFTAQGDIAPTNTEYVLLDLDPIPYAQIHNGGTIHFGPDKKLYVGVGDNGHGNNSQTLTNLLGKILRINADGTIPSDNPFYSITNGKNRAIWALGLRNPFSFAFNTESNRLLINDVGEATWEEVNVGQPGANYGWPYFEGIVSNSSYQDPVYVYGHSGTNSGCAIVGAAFYRADNDNFPAEYAGNYFFGDYCNGWIRRLTNGNVAADFITGLNFLIGFQIGPDGALYVLRRTPYSIGLLYRISWKDQMHIQIADKTSGGSAQVIATARPNHTYVLETSTNLIQWFSAQTNSTSGETVTFFDNSATNFHQQFYRVKE